ncbi:MAG: cadmium-translocating P-type ATPase [Nitratireductor sp.]|nr:cadmium-translocating P-type ATPase [Nitratireductor sp.]
MTCCGGNVAPEQVAGTSRELSRIARAEELSRRGVVQADGSVHFTLSSPSIHCGGCISIIERNLAKVPGVREVRVNLTLKRISVLLENAEVSILDVVEELESLGYQAYPLDDLPDAANKKAASELLRALAVAGFAAMNVMLLSVSAWSGADGATRDLFHLISALIAIPAVAYSGRIFFRSAWSALRGGHLNMDVPISLAVLLAVGMSLYETLNHGEEAYFDAAVSLLFFLLIGRYLDQMMRDRARNAVIGLSRLAAKGANIIGAGGKLEYHDIDEIEPGMLLRILPGERVPVDGVIVKGTSDLDLSLVTGENQPAALGVGDALQAGTYNLTGPLELQATRPASKSFLAEVSGMLAAAEQGRGHYMRIADRMAQIYAPAVHLLALAAFIVWMIVHGDWHQSLYVAISVLIITCPCALGLAVPVVHVVAAARLFEEGILVRDGSALERMAEIDHAVFDKTGTLTHAVPKIVSAPFSTVREEQMAYSLASLSSHPASRSLVRHLGERAVLPLDDVREAAGCGIEAVLEGRRVRLGNDAWVAEIAKGDALARGATGISFAEDGGALIHCEIRERLRDDAAAAIGELAAGGIGAEMLSGDKPKPVEAIAEELGLDKWAAEQKPVDKIARINLLKEQGIHPLMIGDGLNDAPCLAAGHASMAPASASDIGRAAADFVFTRDSLDAIPFTFRLSRFAGRLVRQNFGLAILYNCIAVPLAFFGFVTPLFAAIAMSLSSIVVVTNSLRLSRFGSRKQPVREVETGNPAQHGARRQAA